MARKGRNFTVMILAPFCTALSPLHLPLTCPNWPLTCPYSRPENSKDIGQIREYGGGIQRPIEPCLRFSGFHAYFCVFRPRPVIITL
jgi:hypothetical protein